MWLGKESRNEEVKGRGVEGISGRRENWRSKKVVEEEENHMGGWREESRGREGDGKVMEGVRDT